MFHDIINNYDYMYLERYEMLFKNISIIDENFNLRENVYVVVEGEKITYIGDNFPKGGFGRIIDGRNRILIPGFYNAHGHSPMSLMRGYGENMKLQDWLFNRIFPFEDKLTPDAVYWGTLLSMAESVRFGIVSTSDMYYFAEDMIRAITEAGCKNNISRAITNPSGDDFDKLISVTEMKELASKYNGYDNGKIIVDGSLHAEYTSDEYTATKLAELTKELGLRMHVHVSETKLEHEECKLRHGGRTPVQYLNDCGIFDVPATAAHCVWIEGEDYDILKSKGVTVATNPVSNLKLASGICDVPALLDRDIRVAIGTDSVSSNNNLSFFEEIKTMTLLAKVKTMDPTVVTPKQALYMATRAGALAQGREDCGLIKEGYKADLVMVRTDVPNMVPVHNMLNNLVLSATDADIAMTVIDGKVVYENGEYKTVDIEKTMFEVEKAKNDILKRL